MLNPYLYAHLLSCALVELSDNSGDCYMPNMTLTFDRLTCQLFNSEGNLSVIALSTLLSTPVRSV